MLPSPAGEITTRCHKLQSQAKLPAPVVLRALPEDDARLLRHLLCEGVEYIENPHFEDPQYEDEFTRPLRPLLAALSGKSEDSGSFRLCTFDVPGASAKELRERYLFLRYNYCRRQVLEVLRHHNGTRLTPDSIARLLRWERLAKEARAEIVRENVPLVLAMAKRTRIIGVDLTDLISEGNLALLRAASKFDCERGYKFSTYACRAILKSFSRVATRMSRYRGHFPTEFDPDLEKSDFVQERRMRQTNDCLSELRALVDDQIPCLSDVERTVIRARFALEPRNDDVADRAKTLEQVGELIGVTKERVRQIQNKALAKLRAAIEDGVLAR